MLAPEPFFEPRGTPFSEYHRIKALGELGHHVDLITYPIGRDVALPNLRIFRSARVPFVNRVSIGPSLTKVLLDAVMLFTIARRVIAERYDAAVFEATHGSAPKYKGQNKVNPMAMMFSGVLMLRHLGEDEAGDRLERALAAVIAEGRGVTYDMKPTRDDPTAVGTSQVADAVLEQLGA